NATAVQQLMDFLVVGRLVVGYRLDASGRQIALRLLHQDLDTLVVASLGVGDVVGQGHLVVDIDQQVEFVTEPLHHLDHPAVFVFVLFAAARRLGQALGRLGRNRLG